METRNARISVNNVGKGANTTASANSVGYRIALPNVWISEMGLTRDKREVTLEFDGTCIKITKRKNN